MKIYYNSNTILRYFAVSIRGFQIIKHIKGEREKRRCEITKTSIISTTWIGMSIVGTMSGGNVN